MQQLSRAVAVFCTACICAEVVSQTVQNGWPRRCIKTVAGLYILVMFSRVLPQTGGTLRSFRLPQTSAASVGTLEEALAAEAQDELEETLEQRCAKEAGVRVQLRIVLTQTAEGWAAASVEAVLPKTCTAEQRAAVTALLEDALGTAPVLRDADGEELP